MYGTCWCVFRCTFTCKFRYTRTCKCNAHGNVHVDTYIDLHVWCRLHVDMYVNVHVSTCECRCKVHADECNVDVQVNVRCMWMWIEMCKMPVGSKWALLFVLIDSTPFFHNTFPFFFKLSLAFYKFHRFSQLSPTFRIYPLLFIFIYMYIHMHLTTSCTLHVS